MEKLAQIIEIGLASGFITYLLIYSGAAPKWWYKFVEWWKAHTPYLGKPFTCEYCLPFWISVLFYLYSVIYTSIFYAIDLQQDGLDVLLVPFAATGVAVIFIKLIEKLSTFYISSK